MASKKTLFCLVLLAGLILGLTGCASAPPPVKEEVKPSAPPPAPAIDYNAMVSRSLLSTGNTVRLKAAIARAKAGKDVAIAYIGGSLTEGAGATGLDKNFVSVSGAAFKTLFGSGHAVNAGMSGTPSTLGVIRYQRDVVQKIGANPDIVIIEFAVNDGDDMTRGATYESLVRDILKAKNAPAVILLFSVFRTQWNLQERFIPVGQAYGLPMISIKDAVVPELNSKALTTKQFFADEYHPTNYGHQLMADCLANLFKTVDAAAADPKDISLPDAAVIGKQYQGITMIDSAHVPAGVAIKAGSFSEKDTGLGTFIYAPSERTFPDNWFKKDTTANEPFTMTLTCKNLIMVYKLTSSKAFGTAEVAVDGKVVKTFNGSSGGGWNNPYTDVVLDTDKAARHVITVKMADTAADKMFSILAFGYTK
jgi:lysophospholipase L1-like esterase